MIKSFSVTYALSLSRQALNWLMLSLNAAISFLHPNEDNVLLFYNAITSNLSYDDRMKFDLV